MSVRVEWMSTAWLSVEVAEEGEVIGEHAVTAPYALVIAGDEVTVIEGPQAALLDVLRRLERDLAARDD